MKEISQETRRRFCEILGQRAERRCTASPRLLTGNGRNYRNDMAL